MANDHTMRAAQREIDRLRDRIEELEAGIGEREELRARVAELERERDEARRQVRASMTIRREEGSQWGEEYAQLTARVAELEAALRDGEGK